MVQVSADISASSVGPAVPSPANAPSNPDDSFGGHLQRALPSNNGASNPNPAPSAGQSSNNSPASGSASTTGAQAAAQTPAASNSAATDSSPPDGTAKTSTADSSTSTTTATDQASSKTAAPTDSSTATKPGSDSQTGTHIDNGAGQIPTALLFSIPQPVVSQTTPAAKPAAGTGTAAETDEPVIGDSAASGKSVAQTTSTLTLVAQATAKSAGRSSSLPATGGARAPASQSASAASGSDSNAAALAASGLLPTYGQSVTSGYSQSIANNPVAGTQATPASAVQSTASAMADAVVGMLASAPVAATTHTAPAAAATAAQDGSASTATSSATSSSPGQNSTAATSAANTAPLVSGAVDAAAANRSHSASAGNASGASPTLSDGNRLRLVQRVARAFQSANSANDGSIKLRLSPPELGSVRIEIKVDGGQMNARLDAETPAARDTLLENLPALRDRLQQQDIKVMRFDVGLMGQSPDGSSQTPNRDFDQSAPARRVSQPLDTAAVSDVSDTGLSSSSAAGSAGLDVVI